jgi:hypothetical protein
MFKKSTAMAAGMIAAVAVAGTAGGAELKPRIVVLTDIAPITVEPDDMESSIRLMAHADLFEIEALVATTGWSNSGGKERPDLMRDVIAAYEKDVANLRKRSGQEGFLADEERQTIGYWPSPEYLRSRTVTGSTKMGFKFIGKDNKNAGSDLIIKLADEKDERPLWVGVWGGANTLAQAIWQVQQERTPEQLKEFLHKVRVYTITDQDRPQGSNAALYAGSSHQWMRREFADDLKFMWDESAWNFQNSTGRSNWAKYAELIQGHGALGEMYPKYKYGVEGDTPSYLYVWPNGLNEPEHPEWGGWGGMFERGVGPDKETTAWVNQRGTAISATSRKYETKFYPAEFNSFVARMAWAKEGKGNRNPEVVVNGDSSLLTSLKVAAKAGEAVTLDAAGTKDPDGDKLTYVWWVMTEAGTYGKEVVVKGADTSKAVVEVPTDAAGKSIHVVCEVTDDGVPALTGYRRVVVEVK